MGLRRIKLYTDKDEPDKVAMIVPLLGRFKSEPGSPLQGRFDVYEKTANDLFELTNIEQCDFAVLPFDLGHLLGGKRSLEHVKQFIDKVKTHKKPILCFCWHDSSEQLDLSYDGIIIFRTSLDKSKRKSYEFCYPTFNEDFVDKYLGGELPVRAWKQRPTVGFVGRSEKCQSVNAIILRKTKRLIKGVLGIPVKYPYLERRAKALRVLESHRDIKSEFIVYDKFWGGLGDDAKFAAVTDKQARRHSYVVNMVNSDYILCLRGAGNFTMRIYETLCTGGIPLLVETDTVLPFDDEIDWGKYAVIVRERDISRIGDILYRFHSGLTQQAFEERQRACRALWEEYLSPHGFFRNVQKRLLSLR